MSTWHKQVTQSLADSVSAILSDMKEDQKGTQNGMLKKGKGEPAGQIKPKQDIPEEDDDKSGKKLDPVDKNAVKKKFKDRKDQDLDNDGDTDSSDKFLHKKRKAITKAIRNTSESGKKVKLSGKKETVTIGGVKEETSVRMVRIRSQKNIRLLTSRFYQLPKVDILTRTFYQLPKKKILILTL